MASVAEHYDRVLSDVYSWMLGGFDHAIRRNAEFFGARGAAPAGSGVAIDLGAGCGFQSIPLARAGFSVVAIDIDRKLLDELERHADGLAVRTVCGDLVGFDGHVEEPAELIVCMTDTLLHLESRADVSSVFGKAHRALEPGGRFIATFRDLSTELTELDRFIPVRADADRILTCFLEYERGTVKVHDLLYERSTDGWVSKVSFYRKLRLSADWVRGRLSEAGFDRVETSSDNGLVTIVAEK